MRTLLALLLLAAPLVAQHSQIRVPLDAPGRHAQLLQASFDLMHVEPEGPGGLPHAHLAATAADRARLSAMGIGYELVHADLEGFYAGRLQRSLQEAQALDLAPPYGFGSMGGFHTVSEIETVLDTLSQNHPAIVSPKFSLGSTIEGRPIWCIKISDNVGVDENEPEVLFDGMHHAREPMSMEATLSLAWDLATLYGSDPELTRFVDEREIYLVPCLNPDGYEYNRQTNPSGGGMWRKNRRDNLDGSYGVDLNRNYGYMWGYDNTGSSPTPSSTTYRGTGAFSEPETQALRGLYLARSFVANMTAHSYGNELLWPYSYQNGVYTPSESLFQALGDAMTAINGWAAGISWSLYGLTNGDSTDWAFHDANCLAICTEIGSSSDGFWPPATRIDALIASVMPAMLAMLRSVEPALELDAHSVSEVGGNANGHPDPGETLELAVTLRNTSVVPSGAVALTLTHSGSSAVVIKGGAAMASVPAAGTGDSSGDPFRVQVASTARAGEAIDFDLGIDFAGMHASARLTITAGTPRRVVIDTVETDFAWQLGAPGDGAVRGMWERSAPQATSSSGQACQPGTDHSPAGTLCFVTDGRAGSSAGSWDLDEGPTTLLTPLFDLSRASEARLSYWRWFADVGSSIDDEFVVQITNDDGAHWHDVERVAGGGHNAWEQAAFRVADIVAPSARMRLRFQASDVPNNSVVEALIDDLRIDAYSSAAVLMAWGSHALGTTTSLQIGAGAGDACTLLLSTGSASISIPGIGVLEVDPSAMISLPLGALDAEGHGALALPIPGDAYLAGQTLHAQGVVLGATLALSNAAPVTITP